MNEEVYKAIVKILEANGFKQLKNGDMQRRETGCMFYFKTLSAYKTVVDFQLEWHYTN